MREKRKVVVFYLYFLILGIPFAGAETGFNGDSFLQEGIEAFRASDFQTALYRFREILSDPRGKMFQGDAYFWIARSYLALGSLNEASKHLEYFLVHFKENPYYMEALYEKGRLLYLQNEYSASLEHFYRFLKQYPDSPYGANAYYWIGESLFALGRFREAEKVFQYVVTQFPASFRVEAARFKLEVIQLKYREEELLKLLKWSHEEYLKALEEFQKREAVYADSIKAYQRKIALLSSSDFQGELLKLSERVRLLESELARAQKNEERLTVEKATLENTLLRFKSAGNVSPVGIAEGSPDAAAIKNLLDLLEVKQEALALKEAYLEKLRKEILGEREGEGK
jgi:TolA-binding protein